MKVFVSIALCLVVAACAEDKYETVGEEINVEELLKNDRLLNSYTKCLLNKGPCTPDLKKIKDKLPEALATNCAKCTDKQKTVARQLATEIKKSRPDLWKEFKTFYDPQTKYEKAFQDFLKAN